MTFNEYLASRNIDAQTLTKELTIALVRQWQSKQPEPVVNSLDSRRHRRTLGQGYSIGGGSMKRAFDVFDDLNKGDLVSVYFKCGRKTECGEFVRIEKIGRGYFVVLKRLDGRHRFATSLVSSVRVNARAAW